MKNLKFSFLIAIFAIAIAGCNQSKNSNSDTEIGDSVSIFSIAKKAAIKIKVAEGTIMYYTHDSENQKLRMDIEDAIMLMDYKNKSMSVYSGMWIDIPWNPGAASEDYFDKMSEEGVTEQGYVKVGTMTVLDKVCDVYSVFNSDKNSEIKCAIWNGVTMWIEEDGKVIYEALAVTLDVPENFFEKTTMKHSWIE